MNRRSTISRSILTCLAVAILLALPVAGQTPTETMDSARLERQRMSPRIGFFFGAGVNYHQSAFSGVPEAPNCLICDSSHFSGGWGGGIYAGALVLELPISSTWRLETRAGYYSVGARQTLQHGIGAVDLPSGDTAMAVSEYSLSARFGLVAGGVTLGMRAEGIPITLRVGPEIGLIVSRPYEQREELIAPAAAVYIGPNGERTQIRNDYSGELEKTQLQAALHVSFDYEMALNKYETMLLIPEVAYSFPLGRVRPDLDWKIHQFRAGIAFKYSLPVSDQPQDPGKPVLPLLPLLEPRLAADFNAVSIAHGVEVEGLRITVEEFVTTQMRSLLPYIFYDSGSAELPPRYIKLAPAEANRFGLPDLHNRSALDIYYQTLNTIGMRLRQNPGANLTLVGTNADRGGESGLVALSQKRADRVKSYLVESWGIDPARIATSARNLPSNPSNPDDPDGIAENRRVEISSSDPLILEPVTTTDTLRTVDPPTLRMKMTARAEAGIGTWHIGIEQEGVGLKEFKGGGTLPPIIDWNILADQGSVPEGDAPLNISFELHDGRGKGVALRDTVDIKRISIRKKREERLGDTVFQRFNLITFDFDRAALSRTSQRIADIIRSRKENGSIVEVIGYTDRVGEESHNLELSRQRAVNTARALDIPLQQARGVGETVILYDNDLPEGRFLSRSVEVTIKTPIAQQ